MKSKKRGEWVKIEKGPRSLWTTRPRKLQTSNLKKNSNGFFGFFLTCTQLIHVIFWSLEWPTKISIKNYHQSQQATFPCAAITQFVNRSSQILKLSYPYFYRRYFEIMAVSVNVYAGWEFVPYVFQNKKDEISLFFCQIFSFKALFNYTWFEFGAPF